MIKARTLFFKLKCSGLAPARLMTFVEDYGRMIDLPGQSLTEDQPSRVEGVKTSTPPLTPKAHEVGESRLLVLRKKTESRSLISRGSHGLCLGLECPGNSVVLLRLPSQDGVPDEMECVPPLGVTLLGFGNTILTLK